MALIGIGMTFVIITGGIDVSVGGAIMVCSVVTAKLMRDQALPLVLGVSAWRIATGAVLGLRERRAHRLRASARHHHHLRHGELFLFIGLQIFGSQPISGMPNTLAWFGRGVDGRTLGDTTQFRDHRRARGNRLVVPATHPGRSSLLRRRRRPGRRATRRNQGAAPRPDRLRHHRRSRWTGLHLHPGEGDFEPRPVGGNRPGTGRHRRGGDRWYVDHGWPRLGARHGPRRASRPDREIRCHPTGLAVTAVRPVRRNLHRRCCRNRSTAPTHEEDRHERRHCPHPPPRNRLLRRARPDPGSRPDAANRAARPADRRRRRRG